MGNQVYYNMYGQRDGGDNRTPSPYYAPGQDPNVRVDPNTGAITYVPNPVGAMGGALNPRFANPEQVASRTMLGDAALNEASNPLAGQQQRFLDMLGGVNPDYYRQQGRAISGIDPRSASGIAAQQQAMAQLGRYASGQDSVVEQQNRIAQQRLAQQIGSQLSGNAGRMSGAALRGAQMALSRGSADLSGQAMANAAAERQSATQALAGVGAQAQQNALQAALGQGSLMGQGAQVTGAGDSTAAGLANLALGQRQQARNEALGTWGTALGVPQTPSGTGTWEKILGIGGMLAPIAGSALMMSDETAKTSVKTSDSAVKGMLDQLEAKSWRYKDGLEDGGKDKHTGVMAQALEASPLGKTLVEMGEDGYRRINLHPRRATPLVLAALGNLNKRLNAMEGAKHGRR